MFSLERWGHHDQTVLVVRSALRPGVARSLVDPTGPDRRPDRGHRLVPRRPPAAGWWPTACRPAATSARPCTSSTSSPGACSPTRSPTPVARRSRGLPDCSAFAYTRYPHEGEVPDDERDYWRKVFWHQLGTDPARDPVVWDDLPDKTAWPNVSLSADGRWLLVHVSHRLEPGRRPPDRPQHRRPHGDDRGHRGGLVVRDRGRRGHRHHHPRRRPRPGRVRPPVGGLARQLVHDHPRGRRGARSAGGHLRLAGRAELPIGGVEARPLRPRRHRPPDDRPGRAGLAGRPVGQPRTGRGLLLAHLLRPPADPVPLASGVRSTTGADWASPTARATGPRAPTSSSRCATRPPTAPRSRCS